MKFILGERKEVRIEVISTRGDGFNILNAAYKIVRVIDGVEEASGDAQVEGHEIYAVVEPSQEGTYKLIFSYEIAQEILKAVVGIEV